MIRVGQKVRFDPLKDVTGYGAESVRNHFVTGYVVMVNESHRWFSVEYGNNQRMSFKFYDIGKKVTICG